MIEETRRPTAGFRPGSRWWLIAKDGGGEMLTVGRDGEQSLPVFGFEEEAEMFLLFGNLGGWRARESGAEELASVLSDARVGVRRVVLDPLPRTLTDATAGFVCMDRERFLCIVRRSLTVR